MSDISTIIKKYGPRLITVDKKKGQTYLQVADRLELLRELDPGAKITTTLIEMQPGFACFHSRVELSNGAVGEGIGSETKEDFRDYVEKAQTKSIGRAISIAGIGLQYSLEDFGYEEERATKRDYAGVDTPPTLDATIRATTQPVNRHDTPSNNPELKSYVHPADPYPAPPEKAPQSYVHAQPAQQAPRELHPPSPFAAQRAATEAAEAGLRNQAAAPVPRAPIAQGNWSPAGRAQWQMRQANDKDYIGLWKTVERHGWERPEVTAAIAYYLSEEDPVSGEVYTPSVDQLQVWQVKELEAHIQANSRQVAEPANQSY